MNSMDHIFGISGLIAKHLTGALSADEQQSLDAWLKEDENHVEMFNRIVAHESLAAALIEMEQVNTELALTNVRSRISTLDERKPVRLWPRIAGVSRGKLGTSLIAAAAAVALIVLGVYFFNAPSSRTEFGTGSLSSANDIAPGKNGATITLANGKVIELSDAKSGVVIGDDKLAYNDGSSILSSRANAKDLDSSELGMTNLKEIALTAKTAKGQTYVFTLPDGTKVWLNAASSLTIPSDFSGIETRKVELTGEAYFEVAKNKKRPFIVKSLGQEVTVLGTHFNINAYADEPTVKTTLLEGSVSVSSFQPSPSSRRQERSLGDANSKDLTAQELRSKMSKGAVILKPNEQATLKKDFQIQVQEVQEAERAIAWRSTNGKSGTLYFQNEDLESLMRKVERWYDVQVVYRFKHKRADMSFTGAVYRDATLSQMIKLLQHTGSFTYTIEGRRLIIMD